MIKKIKIQQLCIGMYVYDLNCGWLNHPFLFGNSMKIKDKAVINKIVQFGIRELFIDTEKGLDVPEESSSADAKSPAGEDRHEIKVKPDKTEKRKQRKPENVPITEELNKARKIKHKTIQMIQGIMDNIKLGKQIEKGPAEEVVNDIVDSVFRNQDALIGLGRLRKINDYVYNHSMSVCVLMISFAKHLGYNDNLIREVGIGAMLHDIGTAYVPHEILNKESDLTEYEYKQIKLHVEFGRTLLEQANDISYTSIMTAYHHHERIDGSGYPNGLKGDEITPFGQALAIADVYDALTTKRCYKNKILPTVALKMIYDWGESKFNRELVETFIRSVGIYPAGTLVRLESGLLGFVIDHNENNSLHPVIRVVYDTKKNNYIAFPYDIPLSESGGTNGEEKIVGCEPPDKWSLQAEAYL
jgi:HD-GYP domain-containing protein (c-di-GMP phosphodiesterase class II)